MALFKESTETAFDLSAIRPGFLAWAKHETWNGGRSGFIAAARPDKVIVQYFPGIGNVTNHFTIWASERERWEIRISADLTETLSYPDETGGTEEDNGQ